MCTGKRARKDQRAGTSVGSAGTKCHLVNQRPCTSKVVSLRCDALNGKLLTVEQTFEAKSPLGRLLVEHRERVLAIAREHRATNIHVFGSVARV